MEGGDYIVKRKGFVPRDDSIFQLRKEATMYYLEKYIKKYGHSPSLSEIAKYLSLSRSGAAYIINKRTKDGCVKRPLTNLEI